MNAGEIDSLVGRHFGETTGTMRNCSVSELGRGECTSRPYYIFKIDLTNSTSVLRNVKPALYARVAHAYLSSVDSITQQFSAEPQQTEYQGDSVLALFPEYGNTAIEVVSAAIQAHYAVCRLRALTGLALRPKVLLHYAPLTVAKIGPWSETHRVAIGLPIHLVAKREKDVSPGVIWLSKELAGKLSREVHNKYLGPSYVTVQELQQVPVTTPPNLWNQTYEAPSVGLLSSLGALSSPPIGAIPRHSASGLESLGVGDDLFSQLSSFGAPHSAKSLADVLAPDPVPMPPAQQYETRLVDVRKQDGYELKLIPAYQDLKLPIAALAGV